MRILLQANEIVYTAGLAVYMICEEKAINVYQLLKGNSRINDMEEAKISAQRNSELPITF